MDVSLSLYGFTRVFEVAFCDLKHSGPVINLQILSLIIAQLKDLPYAT